MVPSYGKQETLATMVPSFGKVPSYVKKAQQTLSLYEIGVSSKRFLCLADAETFDDDRGARGKLAEFVGHDSLIGFAALFGSFGELNDGFLAMTTTAKFASAFGSHVIRVP
jgi:hypothetical protein